MSMLPTNAALVQRFAAAMYDVTVGSKTMAQINADIATTTGGLDGVLNKYFSISFGSATTASVAATMTKNLGLVGDAGKSGATYIEGILNQTAAANRGSKVVEMLNTFSGLTADSVFGGAATAFNTRVMRAVEYGSNTQADLVGAPATSTSTGNELSLGRDDLQGGASDDMFVGRIIGSSSTLQSADKITGGGGFDTVLADLASQSFAITPETTGVEAIKIRAQSRATDSGDNNLVSLAGSDGSTNGLIGTRVIVDAERMVGLTHIESNNSRADLIVEDVRILSSQITKDVTIAMVQTDPGNVDFGVYFDQPSLRASTSSQSQLRVQLMDTRFGDTPTPLKNSPYEAIAFTYAGKAVTLKSDGINNAQTYAELLAAFQAAVSTNSDLAGVSVSLGSSFNATDTRSDVIKSGTEIVFKGAGTFTLPEGSGFLAASPVPPDSGLHTFIDASSASSTDLVTSTVILDHVGRGSNGGDLVIGGLSVGETSTSRGVDRFEITVERDSRLQTVNSTNNWLKEVVIKNGATKGTLSVLGTDVVAQNAGHVSSDELPGLTQPITPPPGSTVPPARTQHNTFGFTDVRLIDASAMAGAVSLDAELSNSFRAKFITDTDQAPAQPGDDNSSVTGTTVQRQDVRYSGGAGSDTITVQIDSANLTANTGNTVLPSREDFSFVLAGNAGNDSLRVSVNQDGTGPANWYSNQKLLGTAGMISVQGGEGNDTIRTPGHGDFRIADGPGNDVVYSDNSGVIGARWDINTASSAAPNDVLSATNTPGFVWKPQVRVTFSGPQVNGAGGVTGEGTGDDALALKNGFESAWVDVPLNSATSSITRIQLMQAIKTAVNGDSVLSKVLEATDGPAYSLFVTSRIDGKFDEDDLMIDFRGGTPAATDEAELVRLYQAFAGNSKATLADAVAAHSKTIVDANALSGMGLNQVLGINTGAASSAQTDKRIDVGAGDDVYVLGTSPNSTESLVFSGYSLGKKTVINFSDATSFPATPTDARVDSLNFASYLTSKITSSGSDLSSASVPITTSTSGAPSVEANEVIFLNGMSFTKTKTFAGLDAEAVRAAINSSNSGANDYGSLNAALLDANNSYVGSGAGSLVGGVGKAVVLIENAANVDDAGLANLGEYKVFELTFDGTSANTKRDFSDVKWIATIDLGDTWGTAGVSGSGGGGGSTPIVPPPIVLPPTVTTPSVAVSAAGSATETSATNTTYTVGPITSSYTYTIAGFGAGDKIVSPSGAAATIDNSSFTDGTFSLQYASGGNVVKITLTGLTSAQDLIFGVNDLNTIFGAGTFV